jgi:hypothetical protein
MRDMPPALLRLKGEICRLSADPAENVVREAIWLDLADCWEQLAKEAAVSDPSRFDTMPSQPSRQASFTGQ